jgi:ParB family chromosome partitioning protein
LADSIETVGLLHPIVVTPEGRLIAGQRRLEACRLLGWQEIPITVIDLYQAARGEAHENFVRKDLLPSEIVALKRAIEPLERHAGPANAKAAARTSDIPPLRRNVRGTPGTK